MKFAASSLFLALLVVAANAVSLEKVDKVENVEVKAAADKIEPESAEPTVPAPVVKSEPVEIVEAKSEEVVKSDKAEEEKPVTELKAIVPDAAEPVEAESKPETVCNSLKCESRSALILFFDLVAGHHPVWSSVPR